MGTSWYSAIDIPKQVGVVWLNVAFCRTRLRLHLVRNSTTLFSTDTYSKYAFLVFYASDWRDSVRGVKTVLKPVGSYLPVLDAEDIGYPPTIWHFKRSSTAYSIPKYNYETGKYI